MITSRLCRAAAVAVLGAGLLASVATTAPARAAGHPAAKTVKPIVLVVDTAVSASGLTQADALKRAGALLPITVTAPSYVPAGSQLFSISVERPFYQVTKGMATLIYGSQKAGVTFEVDEAPAPIVYGKATQTPVVINGWAGMISDLGTIGKAHLVAITWTIGKRNFAVTSNLGKSKLSTVTLVKVANSLK